MRDIAAQLEASAEAVNRFLEAQLLTGKRSPRLMAAMRHAVFAGGKRMRPFLVQESARLFDIAGQGPLHVAAALEMVHCYSLVHDDLPAMDDDDMRRGQPTLHRAYDEATAILAGDGLLTLAFAVLAQPETSKSAARRLKLITALAIAAGVDGMVGGQMLDLDAEGRFTPGERAKKLSARAIRRLQALKTGALIVFAVQAGALLAPRASREEKRALRLYGEALGLAFQIKDDLLDSEGEAALVGKAVAKDAEAGKATFVGLYGLEGARTLLKAVSDKGAAALAATFGERAETLTALMRFNMTRNH